MAVRGLGLGLGAAPVGFKGGGAVLWAYCLLARAWGTSGGAFDGSGGGGFTRLMRRSGEEGTGNQHLQTVQIGPAHQVMAQQSQLNRQSAICTGLVPPRSLTMQEHSIKEQEK